MSVQVSSRYRSVVIVDLGPFRIDRRRQIDSRRYGNRSLHAPTNAIVEIVAWRGLDPSSVSRMLRGERKMTADEQDGIAAYLDVPLTDVAARRRG